MNLPLRYMKKINNFPYILFYLLNYLIKIKYCKSTDVKIILKNISILSHI